MATVANIALFLDLGEHYLFLLVFLDYRRGLLVLTWTRLHEYGLERFDYWSEVIQGIRLCLPCITT